MKKELSVVVPAYNEEKRIGPTLMETANYLDSRGYQFEIIVVSDGSTDSTVSVIREAAQKYPQIRLLDRSRNSGKGQTVREGVGEARFSYCLFMDADNSTTIWEWDKFEACFDRGWRAVVGSRHLPLSKISHPQPWLRRFLGWGYRFLCRRLFGLKVSDFNCGFKAYETSLAKQIFSELRMGDWTFDVELFCLLKKQSVEAAEVPVAWEHREKKGRSFPLVTAAGSLKSLWRFKKNLGKGNG